MCVTQNTSLLPVRVFCPLTGTLLQRSVASLFVNFKEGTFRISTRFWKTLRQRGVTVLADLQGRARLQNLEPYVPTALVSSGSALVLPPPSTSPSGPSPLAARLSQSRPREPPLFWLLPKSPPALPVLPPPGRAALRFSPPRARLLRALRLRPVSCAFPTSLLADNQSRLSSCKETNSDCLSPEVALKTRP